MNVTTATSTSKPFRPLLAATIENDEQLQLLRFPMIVSPKVDGIRVLCHPILGPVTRSLKPVPNKYVREKLSRPEYFGFDGEIVSGHFQSTASAIMTYSGEPSFTYWVFDTYQLEMPYVMRLFDIEERIRELKCPEVKVLTYEYVIDVPSISVAEHLYLSQGYEGIMLRLREGKYKWGRSTFNEQLLLKLKRFQDAEATVIGFEALQRNRNEATRNTLGLQERSSHKDGKVVDALLGNLIVQHPDFGVFGIGSGFDVETRTAIWKAREEYLGKQVTFKYQPTGIKEKPRFPIFLRFRPQE